MTGGETAGTIEVATTSVEQFTDLFWEKFKDTPLIGSVDEFTRNYKKLLRKVEGGPPTIDRSQMPVIDKKHIDFLRHHLVKGRICVNPPYNRKLVGLLGQFGHDDYMPKPEDIERSEELRELWAEHGTEHDKIAAFYAKRRARRLIPIQKQIYIDKIFANLAEILEAHPDNMTKHLRRHYANTTLIVAGDDDIIDGDHRWASMMVVEPEFKFNALVIDMEIEKLIKLTLAFTALLGNKPNA